MKKNWHVKINVSNIRKKKKHLSKFHVLFMYPFGKIWVKISVPGGICIYISLIFHLLKKIMKIQYTTIACLNALMSDSTYSEKYPLSTS